MPGGAAFFFAYRGLTGFNGALRHFLSGLIHQFLPHPVSIRTGLPQNLPHKWLKSLGTLGFLRQSPGGLPVGGPQFFFVDAQVFVELLLRLVASGQHDERFWDALVHF